MRTICSLLSILLFTTSLFAQNISGTYSADDGGMYYVRQVNNQVWWAGLSAISPLGQNDIHPGINFSNVFFGTLSGSTVIGEWADVPRGTTLQAGKITLSLTPTGLRKVSATGGFGATTWTRQNLQRPPFDVFSVFDKVRKNNAGGGSLLDNLKPAKSAPVSVFGSIQSHAPNPPISLAYSIRGGRSYWDFACMEGGGSADGDIDMDILVDRANLDTQFGFWVGGWETDHKITPDRFRAKLDADNQRLHLESIMFGGDLNCDDSGAPHFFLPGWQNAGASGVLFNGMPVAGNLTLTETVETIVFPPNPFFPNVPPLVVHHTWVNAISGRSLQAGDRVRVNGILNLDCGHSSWHEYHPCYEDDTSEHNQEMHPVYAIDVVQDFSRRSPWADLTGVWAANDNGTYYVRQIGGTVWWLYLSSDEGRAEAHVFHGTFSGGNTSLSGSWMDVPLGNLAQGGSLTVSAPQAAKSTVLTRAAGGEFAGRWDKLRDVVTPRIVVPVHPAHTPMTQH